MLRPADQYFLQQQEPTASCLQALRKYILSLNNDITEHWKYGMPFYYYKEYRFCYLWIHKKLNQPYIGFVNGNKLSHPDLLAEKRSRMKILLVNPAKNLPLKKIQVLLHQALELPDFTP